MTARDIQRRLISERYRRNFCLPNYTPSGWWECDVFELTSAGYFVEYEIKLSRGDFMADGRKQKTGFEWNPTTRSFSYPPGPNKHRQLSERHNIGPVRFYFVFPKGMVTLNEVPEWAGAIECHKVPDNLGYRPPWSVVCRVVKKAPQLHSQAADPKIRQHAQTISYWRFLNLFCYGKESPSGVENVINGAAIPNPPYA